VIAGTAATAPQSTLRWRGLGGITMRALVFSAFLLTAAATAAHAATADHGNIVVNGKAVTHSGQDSDPVASPDGKPRKQARAW